MRRDPGVGLIRQGVSLSETSTRVPVCADSLARSPGRTSGDGGEASDDTEDCLADCAGPKDESAGQLVGCISLPQVDCAEVRYIQDRLTPTMVEWIVTMRCSRLTNMLWVTLRSLKSARWASA